MVDVSLRDKRKTPIPARRRSHWTLPLTIAAASVATLVVAGVIVHLLINAYRDRMTLTGLSDDPTPVALAIAGEPLAIPANMLRYAATRRGGPVERADLIMQWPTLQGYSDRSDGAFTQVVPSAAIVYATISARDSALDASQRLDEVYARFFTGKALPGPAGLVGRTLTADSGYAGEIVFFSPHQPRPFVARCLAGATAEIPSTCLRDIQFGRGLMLLYRFDRELLPDWQALDTGLRTLAAGFLKR